MNSITVIARIKLDAGELDALDFMAARQLQTRDDFIQGIVRRAVIKAVLVEPMPAEHGFQPVGAVAEELMGHLPRHDAPGAA